MNLPAGTTGGTAGWAGAHLCLRGRGWHHSRSMPLGRSLWAPSIACTHAGQLLSLTGPASCMSEFWVRKLPAQSGLPCPRRRTRRHCLLLPPPGVCLQSSAPCPGRAPAASAAPHGMPHIQDAMCWWVAHGSAAPTSSTVAVPAMLPPCCMAARHSACATSPSRASSLRPAVLRAGGVRCGGGGLGDPAAAAAAHHHALQQMSPPGLLKQITRSGKKGPCSAAGAAAAAGPGTLQQQYTVSTLQCQQIALRYVQ
jgi:hypothetical protein